MKPYGLMKTEFFTYRYTGNNVDAGGSPITTFSVEKTLYGNIQPYTSTEAAKAGREFSNSMLKIYCKETDDVIMKDRVFIGSEFYDIVELETFPNSYKKLICSRTK